MNNREKDSVFHRTRRTLFDLLLIIRQHRTGRALPRRWILKRVGIICVGVTLTMLFISIVVSDAYLFFRSRQFIPSRDLDYHIYEEQVLTGQQPKIINIINSSETSGQIRSKKSATDIRTLQPSQNTTENELKKLNTNVTKSTTLPANFTGPFSINDTNPPLDVQILHLPQNLSTLCHSEKKLIVIVVSSPWEFAQRAAIRQTWATNASNETSVIFHVGLEKPIDINAIMDNSTDGITEEQLQYGDIIMSNVVEDYYNLTLKTYATITFISLHCKQAKCVLKSDSDTVVNLSAIEKLCNETDSLEILGSCGVGRPDRNPRSKWYTPIWVWPGNYTKFCLGSAYMLVGLNASALLLDHLSETNFFHSGNFRKMGEDVVWTGFVAEKANINRTHVVGFSPQTKLAYHCFADGEKAALTVHYIKGLENITKYWKWMRTPGKCVPNTESSGWFPFSYFMYFDYNAARDKLIKRH